MLKLGYIVIKGVICRISIHFYIHSIYYATINNSKATMLLRPHMSCTCQPASVARMSLACEIVNVDDNPQCEGLQINMLCLNWVTWNYYKYFNKLLKTILYCQTSAVRFFFNFTNQPFYQENYFTNWEKQQKWLHILSYIILSSYIEISFRKHSSNPITYSCNKTR